MNQALIEILADGQFHSGEDLGRALGVTRAAIWKQLQKLEQLNIPLNSIKGRGYRLPEAVELLTTEALSQAGFPFDVFDRCDLHLSLDSTNDELMRRASSSNFSKQICFAEMQTSGRGRRGRQWLSPFARNLYFSLAWPFEQGMAAIQGLSLAVGLAVFRVLKRHNIPALGLKWPNDILVGEAKLGGILIELSGAMTDVCQVVIGIGLNLDLPDADQQLLDQKAIGLKQLNADLSRNALAAELAQELTSVLAQFSKAGFKPFQQEWNAANQFANEAVTLHLPSAEMTGICLGVSEIGELLLKTEAGTQHFNAGEVSLRPAGRSA